MFRDVTKYFVTNMSFHTPQLQYDTWYLCYFIATCQIKLQYMSQVGLNVHRLRPRQEGHFDSEKVRRASPKLHCCYTDF